MFSMPIRKGFSMKIEGVVNLNRTDMHNIATELGVQLRDVVMKDGLVIIYNTSDECQEIVDDNALASFVALALEISSDKITDIKEIEEEPVKLEFDLEDFED
jgi:hypothetical protein